jgi:hypothetical protein
MAMPIGSMIQHFREEFEQHISAARSRREREELAAFSAEELAAVGEAGPA